MLECPICGELNYPIGSLGTVEEYICTSCEWSYTKDTTYDLEDIYNFYDIIEDYEIDYKIEYDD